MDKLSQLQELTSRQFNQLIDRFPDLERRGLTLFLGSHYAEPNLRIMMLGINPGLDEDLPADYDIRTVNCLLDQPSNIRYWQNAQRCFNATPELRQMMEYATFAFCAPFRTAKWTQTPSAQRNLIVSLSRPILQQMLDDCRPTAVILAGVLTVNLFAHIAELKLTPRDPVAGSWLSKTWGHYIGQESWGEFDVLQVPHFSYFNAHAGLDQCGRWLTQKLELRIFQEYGRCNFQQQR